MYAVHAPRSSGRLIGASAALLATAGMGALLVASMTTDFIPQAVVRTEIITLAPDEPVQQPEPVAETLPTEVAPVEPEITTELPPPIEMEPTILAEVAPSPAPAPAPAASPGPAGATSSPSLRTRSIPPYPPASVRNGEQGTTTVEVCVDAGGRVSAATLAGSSGHARLDEAAMKWIRSSRFNPAQTDGRPVATCGFQVAYEWNLENAR